MSDDEKYGGPGFLRRVNEFADRMTSEKLREMSRDEIAAIMQAYQDFLRQAEIPPPPPGFEMECLALELAARQGTFLTDFESLYRRKAELERELFERHDRP
jgi:hypothetical protein